MRVVKLFMGAMVFIALLNELVKMEIKGNDKLSVMKTGLLIIFEMWLLED